MKGNEPQTSKQILNLIVNESAYPGYLFVRTVIAGLQHSSQFDPVIYRKSADTCNAEKIFAHLIPVLAHLLNWD